MNRSIHHLPETGAAPLTRPWATASCHGPLPRPLVTAPCHGPLSRPLATSPCPRPLPPLEIQKRVQGHQASCHRNKNDHENEEDGPFLENRPFPRLAVKSSHPKR